MNTAKPPLVIAVTAQLPVTIDGGLTIWSIQKDRYGKGGGRLAVIAKCIQSGEIITLMDGRADTTEHALTTGLVAKPGTTAYKIFTKLIREGKAVKVS